MEAVFLTPAGFLEREIPVPVIGADELLIRTVACGVCEGDLFIYRTREQATQEPRLLGHEGSGIVVEAGRNVRGFAPGDVVTALGGAYASYFAARPNELVHIPHGLDPRLALGEPVACCVHAGNRFGIHPGDRVALLGCGFMGLVCLQLARYQGAAFVCAVDPLEERQARSRQLGADVTYSPAVLADAAAVAALGAFDVVIEAAGVAATIDLATQLVAQHGRIVIVGYHQSQGGLRTINMQAWNFKAVDVVNGHVRRMDEKLAAMRQGLQLMAEGHLVTEPLVTSYALADTEQAFEDLLARKSGLFKAVLCPAS